MDAAGRRFKTESSAQLFEISENIPASLFRANLGRQDQSFFRLRFPLKEKQSLPKFERHWNESVFPALAVQQDEQVVEVDVFPVKTQCLINPTARVSKDTNEGRQTMRSHLLWLPIKEQSELRC